MNLDLDDIECFVVLAAECHFGRAAKHLHLSTSALSKRISRLESSVGARLVDRDAGGMTGLTRPGASFLTHCEPLLRAAREARRDALHATQPAVVRMGVPGSPTDHFPVQAWRMVSLALAQSTPAGRLELRDVPYGWIEQSLFRGWTDVLLTSAPVEHEGLVSITLGGSGRVLHVPRGHPLEETGTATLADVADLTLVREPTAPAYWMSPWLLGDVRGVHGVRTVDVRARNIQDVDRAVQQRVATAVFSALTPITQPGLVSVPILDAPVLPFYAVRRQGDERDVVLALLQTLRVLSAALSVQHAASATRSPGDGGDTWWVAWSTALAADQASDLTGRGGGQ